MVKRICLICDGKGEIKHLEDGVVHIIDCPNPKCDDGIVEE